MARRGNPGYGKMKNLEANMDKFEPLFWQLMEKMGKSKSKDDQRFFIQEFNKIQTKMIPQTLDGTGEGGEIKVNVMQYGNSSASPIPTKRLPVTTS